MISVARKRILGEPGERVVHLTCGDGARLPFAGASFGSLFVSFTLELFDTPEIAIVLRECRRVLRERGRLCVVAMASRDTRGLPVRMYEWAHHRFPVWLDCRPIPVSQLIREGGFRVLMVRALSMWGLPVDIVLAQA
jgi:demethylmenaquinone methyltransferase/2-methoxy-6-polyprenyl-1,4-benzoquinol methylase